MREPRFWARDVDPKSREAAPILRLLLTPIAWIYADITRRRIRSADAVDVSPVVICVGNLTAGGVGKSPVVSALRHHIETQFKLRVATLSRGYKGRLKGPLKVLSNTHSSKDVGDEPFMLSFAGESWIGADRALAGQAMAADGVDVIIMDDGHQNPGLKKDFSIIVVDAVAGFGNGFVIPKGPLRETIGEGLRRADAIIVMGDGQAPTEIDATVVPVFRGSIKPAIELPEGRYVAFAGIGRPEKFFDTVQSLGATLLDSVPFPDHHDFTSGDLRYLRRLAEDHDAQLITTEKDFVRLSEAARDGIAYLPIRVEFDMPGPFNQLIHDWMKTRRDVED
ncbi:MAG: tetraacyldisaccharide 4'-kinase [Pseudomonadota bacterium]